tara:strand:- start:354 stop:683 length:330 start_codon:yes stop_codon:yes gene_type:complete
MAEFSFRVWIHPVDGDSADIETWCYELEPTDEKRLSIAEWAKEHLANLDLHNLFELNPDKHWQIIGKATLTGSYDYQGEYDEELDLIEFQKAEVPDRWYKFGLSLNDTD